MPYQKPEVRKKKEKLKLLQKKGADCPMIGPFQKLGVIGQFLRDYQKFLLGLKLRGSRITG